MTNRTVPDRTTWSRTAATSRNGNPAAALADGIEIIAELGNGAYATVYHVRRDGIDYALKLLHQGTDGSGRSLQELRREGALLARLDHPGVPRVFEVGQAGSQPYLVMDLLAGTSLAEVLELAPLDEAAAVRLGLEVADAMAAAHRVGLVHRDLKPDNIILAADGAARLIDFGLAARGQDEPDEGGTFVGTFEYCAPEQTGMLRRPVDGRADLYSLGVVLFECVTGDLPFNSGPLRI